MLIKNFSKTNSILKPQISNKKFVTNYFRKIKRHFDVLLTQSHTDYPSTLMDPSTSMYTNQRQFQAYLTKNAYDMSIFNEYDLWPHTNFGTIDNPVLIFSANASWRMVICTGPGAEEESSMHEKMYMIVREGPIHRCMFCGQCFKLVKLKDSVTDEKNSYYSSVFTQISNKTIGEPERLPYYTFQWASHEVQLHSQNIIPENRSYLFINADEADELMTNPAKRAAKYKEMELEYQKYMMVIDELKQQNDLLRNSSNNNLIIPKEIFERWIEVEKYILNIDRVFNRFEKFNARHLNDPKNHFRREKRMLERKSNRENDNYTYYFNSLTEQEQMYRDYFESDLEEFPDDDVYNTKYDERLLRNSEDFDITHVELVDSQINVMERSPVEDMLDKALFKYKYRKITDLKYEHRNNRVIERFIERNADKRNISMNLNELLENKYVRDNGVLDIEKLLSDKSANTSSELDEFANYVAEEGLQQFKDYYESDQENSVNEHIYNELNEREKIRFAECYEGLFTKNIESNKYYVTIPKRPYDDKKSILSNFLADLVDFNERVRPIARALAFEDKTSEYQPLPISQAENNNKQLEEGRYRKVLSYNGELKNKH